MKQVLTTFGALLGFAMVTPAIQATLLTPGAGPTALTGISSLPAGSIVSNGGNASVLPFVGTDASGTTLYQGTLYLAVYREAATGFLDFLYQIQNSKKSQNGIQRTTNADFSAASSVDATFLTGTAPRGFLSARGEIAPRTRSRASRMVSTRLFLQISQGPPGRLEVRRSELRSGPYPRRHGLPCCCSALKQLAAWMFSGYNMCPLVANLPCSACCQHRDC